MTQARIINTHRWLALSAAVLTWCFAASAQAEFRPTEKWYQVVLQDQPSGWMHARTAANEAGEIETAVTMNLTVGRGDVSMSIEVSSRFAETGAGVPLRAESRQKLAAMEVTQAWTFTRRAGLNDAGGDAADAGYDVEIVTKQATQERRQTVSLPGGWLPPEAAARAFSERLAAGEDEIVLQSVDPLIGPKVIESRTAIKGRENVEVMGRTVPAVVAEQRLSVQPGMVMKVYLDARGQPVKLTTEMMGMSLAVVEADRELALAKVSPPELMAATLIRPNRPIENARSLRSGVYQLTLAQAIPAGDGRDKLLPRSGYQRVVWGDAGTARVVVDLDQPVEPGADIPGPEHRAASHMLDHEDEAVAALVRKALADVAEASVADKAERLRQFVHAYIKTKDLSVGFASAGEVARTREGDCTEHAVLLAAMLRGAGLPSRTVSGLLYVDEFLDASGVFGYHMWTQAWIDDGGGGRWVDLDPSLPDRPFDATHIILSTQTMSDGANDLLTLAPLMGGLSVEVVEPSGE